MHNTTPLPELDPQILWEGLLSADEDLILDIYVQLDENQGENVMSHLQKMATEEGWHPAQRESAQIALTTIAEYESRKHT